MKGHSEDPSATTGSPERRTRRSAGRAIVWAILGGSSIVLLALFGLFKNDENPETPAAQEAQSADAVTDESAHVNPSPSPEPVVERRIERGSNVSTAATGTIQITLSACLSAFPHLPIALLPESIRFESDSAGPVPTIEVDETGTLRMRRTKDVPGVVRIRDPRFLDWEQRFDATRDEFIVARLVGSSSLRLVVVGPSGETPPYRAWLRDLGQSNALLVGGQDTTHSPPLFETAAEDPSRPATNPPHHDFVGSSTHRGLAGGPFALTIVAGGYAEERVEIASLAADEQREVRIQLRQPDGIAHGRVVTSDGAPARRGTVVELYSIATKGDGPRSPFLPRGWRSMHLDPYRQYVQETQCNDDGSFRIEKIADGHYVVRTVANPFVHVASAPFEISPASRIIERELAFPAAGRLEIAFPGDMEYASSRGISCALTQECFDLPPAAPPTFLPSEVAGERVDGRFLFEEVVPGTYRIALRLAPATLSTAYGDGTLPSIEIDCGSHQLDPFVEPAITLPCGEKLGYLRVTIRNADALGGSKVLLCVGERVLSLMREPDGTYTGSALPGPAKIVLLAESGEWCWDYSLPIEVLAGAPTEVAIDATPHIGTMEVLIKDRDGIEKPCVGTAWVQSKCCIALLSKSLELDEHGRVSLILPPGEYVLRHKVDGRLVEHALRWGPENPAVVRVVLDSP